MQTESFTITRRPGWAFMGELKVDVTCAPDASAPVKLGLAVKAAVRSGARLDGASLVGARLDGASLVGARLDGARLVGASLVGARLDGARLDGARLVGASLDGARLDGASLDGARLDDRALRPFKADLWATLVSIGGPDEVRHLIGKLRAGEVDGSTYGGPNECACLVGTIAQAKGVAASSLDHGSDRPAEQWFMMIRPGDKPGDKSGGGFAAAKALEWALGYCAALGIDPDASVLQPEAMAA